MVAMTDYQELKMNAEPKQDKSVFIFRVFRIGNDPGRFIEKRGLSFFKGDAMLGLIGTVFFGIPNKSKLRHTYSVNIL